jgi:hypothetical protein
MNVAVTILERMADLIDTDRYLAPARSYGKELELHLETDCPQYRDVISTHGCWLLHDARVSVVPFLEKVCQS